MMVLIVGCVGFVALNAYKTYFGFYLIDAGSAFLVYVGRVSICLRIVDLFDRGYYFGL